MKTALERLQTAASRLLASEQRAARHREYLRHPAGSPLQILLGNAALGLCYRADHSYRSFRFRQSLTHLQPHLDTARLDLATLAGAVAEQGPAALAPTVTVSAETVVVRQIDASEAQFTVPRQPLVERSEILS